MPQTPYQNSNIQLLTAEDLPAAEAALEACYKASGTPFLSRHPRWLQVLREALGHRPFCLVACDRPGSHDSSERQTYLTILPLAHVRSPLFGSRLVSLPYVNYGGALGRPENASGLIREAVLLAERLGVRYLELRHDRPVEHSALPQAVTDKVHMRLALPDTVEALWKSLSPKVRNQIRKSEKLGLVVEWGREEFLTDFYRVFCHNMRDLGTPVFPRKLFAGILRAFPEAEIAIVRLNHRTLAAGIVLHGSGVTEVPSASSLRKWNWTCANMGLYWAMLKRSIERGQAEFDFGRSTLESSTYRFKKQWGAQPHPAHWQYHVFRGSARDLRPDNPRFRFATAVWRRLPVWLTRCLGPWIVKGIP